MELTDVTKSDAKRITIVYKNWRGEIGERTIMPIRIWFGSNEWHRDEQWLMAAFDIDKQAERDFALKDIQSWS